MIYVDNRAGSKDYAPLIPNGELCRLDSGDVCFSGHGPGGDVVVGIELKSLGDVLNSICTGRFADVQAPNMIATYDYSYLIVEGTWTADDDGVLVSPRRHKGMVPVTMGARRFMYTDLEQWLTSVENQAGIKVKRTISKRETVATIMAIYHWFQRSYSEHKSFKCLHETGPDVALLTRPKMFQRMLALVPRVGWERSQIILPKIGEVRFIKKDGRPMEMADWFIENQIAEGTAVKIMEALGANTNHSRTR